MAEYDMWRLGKVPKDDMERDRWQFVPLERVGPLRFGMTHDEVVAALDGVRNIELRGRGSERHLIFREAGINADFDHAFGIACVAIDAFDGPQVVAPDGFALVGRLPSQAQAWVLAQVAALDTQWIISEYLDAAIEEIGLVLRVQRAGDANLTRPLFVARAWFEETYPHTSGGRIPEYEFHYMV